MTEKKYMAKSGYSLVGFEAFPFTTKDEEIQKQVEGTKAFANGVIWITDTEGDAELEGALSDVKFGTLRKLANAMGHRDVHKLTKSELLEILEKEGF